MKKALACFLSLVMLLGLCACGSDAEDETPADSINAADYEVTEAVTFEFWYTYPAEAKQAWFNEKVEEFNASQDLITVEPVYYGDYAAVAEGIAAAQAAGSGLPGVALTNYPRVLTFAESGVIEPINNYATAAEVDMSDFIDGFITPLTYSEDEQLYGLPWAPSTNVYYYNADLLDQLNLTFPETWDDFKTFVKAVYDATGKSGFTMIGSENNIYDLILNAGVDIFGDGTKSNVSDAAVTGWVNEMKALVDAGYVDWLRDSTASTDALTAFYGGETAGLFYTSFNGTTIAKTAEFTVGSQFSLKNKTANATTSGAAVIVPAGNDQNTKNAAMQFALWLTNTDNTFSWTELSGAYPFRQSVMDDTARYEKLIEEYPIYANLYDHLDLVVSKNHTPYFTKGMKLVTDALGQIMVDGSDMDTTWSSMNEELDYLMSGN